MAEPSLFQEGSVRITRRRIIVDDKEYDIREVTSVQLDTAPLSRILLWGIIVLGLVAVSAAQLNGQLICLIPGVILFVLAGFLWWRASRTYILLIGTREGEKRVLVSRDRKYVDRIAQIIDSMIMERSRITSSGSSVL